MRTPSLSLILLLLLVISLDTQQSDARELRLFTDDLNRVVKIPVAPQRIAAMSDIAVAVPLVELGSSIVASRGRLDRSGMPFFRGVIDLFPEFLTSNNITFVGTNFATDYEALAEAQPDLIIGRTWDQAELTLLTSIAPVVLFDDTADGFQYYQKIADAAGRLETFNILHDKYDIIVERGKILLGDHNYSFQSVRFTSSPTISVCGQHGALGQVLSDLKFTIVGRSAAINAKGSTYCEGFSAELVSELDADFIFDSYRADVDPTGPIDAFGRIDGTIRGACDQLKACMAGRVIYVPQEYAFPVSFRSLSIMLHFVISHVAGRSKISMPN